MDTKLYSSQSLPNSLTERLRHYSPVTYQYTLAHIKAELANWYNWRIGDCINSKESLLTSRLQLVRNSHIIFLDSVQDIQAHIPLNISVWLQES
jgi:hypothetical protein